MMMRRWGILLPLAALLVAASGCKDMVISSDILLPGGTLPDGSSTPSGGSTPTADTEPDNGLPLITPTEYPMCAVPTSRAAALAKVAPGARVEVIPNSYIVVLQDNVEPAEMIRSASASGAFAKGSAPRLLTSVVKGFAGRLSDDEVAALRSDPRVKYIEPDYRIKLDARAEGAQAEAAQATPWGVQAVGGSRDGTGRTAWIIDTGIDLDNADLNVDQARSRNFADDGRTSAMDRNGHGTHVAGIIGARDNTIGVVGVAPNATLVAVRVLNDTGAGSYSGIIAGLDYVTANARAGDVINMSLGGPASRVMDDAVRRAAKKGIKVALAAGNETADADSCSPARTNYAGVYTVSAIDANGSIAGFSNFGTAVDAAAPGVRILSTRLGGGTVYMSGTSMATPHVAGLLLFGKVHANGYAAGDIDGCSDPLAYK